MFAQKDCAFSGDGRGWLRRISLCSHACLPSGVFGQVHAPAKNG